MYDYSIGKDIVVTHWFKLFIPCYAQDKKYFKHNNNRKSA